MKKTAHTGLGVAGPGAAGAGVAGAGQESAGESAQPPSAGGRRVRRDSLSAKIRIIEAGEQLMAERGIDGPSLREIAEASGNRNTNAVQYHFGSKDGLLQAIFAHRVKQMDGPRRQMLAAAERNGKLDDPKTLLEALCLPHVDIVDAAGRHNYSTLLCNYIIRFRPVGILHAADHAGVHSPALKRIQHHLGEVVGWLPEALRIKRLELCSLMFFNMLSLSDAESVATTDPDLFSRYVDDTMNLVAGAFTLRP